jgi:RNase P subunit RPR2
MYMATITRLACRNCQTPLDVAVAELSRTLVYPICSDCGIRYRLNESVLHFVSPEEIDSDGTAKTPYERGRRWQMYLFIRCNSCGQTFAHAYGLNVDPLVIPCERCDVRITLSPRKAPIEVYSEEAEACSPDDSAAAYWKTGDLPRLDAKFPAVRAKKPATDTSGLGDLESQVERLAALREYERTNRERFKDDPILLEAFDRLIARKKRQIMGNPE